MGNDKQIQKAGDNSSQYQAQVVNVTNNYVMGIDEHRVKEICSELAVDIAKSYTAEATEKAVERIENYTTTLIPRLEKIENDFRSLSDPSFQFLLQSSQKTAACTDREADYEMLAELLVHRVEKGNDRKAKASIAKAVEIVDQIDDDALCALTVVYAIDQWSPVSGNITSGLLILEDLFSSLLYMDLPNEYKWVYHLDLLNTVRASSLGSFKKFEDYYSERLNGYVCVGIKKDSDIYEKVLDLLKQVNMPQSLLEDNELLPGYVRLKTRGKLYLEDMTYEEFIPMLAVSVPIKVNAQQIDILKEIWELYSNDQTLMSQVKKNFVKKLDEFPSLKTVKDWWNKLPHSFRITPIGEVLAHANAQRYNKKVPDRREV